MPQAPAFPAGEYVDPGNYSDEARSRFIQSLAEFPNQLAGAVQGLDENRLEIKYRNWSLRQIVHHLADSHLNCYVRFKWALTEPTPVIKSYDESLWSQVCDAQQATIEFSLATLQGIHGRWTYLLTRFSEEDWDRAFFHPELDRAVSLQQALPAYAWHGQHHLAQIEWVKQNRF